MRRAVSAESSVQGQLRHLLVGAVLLAAFMTSFAVGAAPAAPAARASGMLAFTASASASGNTGIYLAAVDGTSVFALTAENGFSSPAWSPDGKRIAFDGYAGGGPGRSHGIWVAQADGSHLRRLARAGRQPAWSPDGQKIVYAAEDESALFTVNAKGGPAQRFPMPYRDYDKYFSSPAWSPDGKEIAFYAEADGGAFAGIFVVGVDGRHRREIIDGGFLPAWSPDGREIAFSDGEAIFVARVDGTHRRRVVGGGNPAWSPDGRRFAFERGTREIWVVGSNGLGAHRVLSQPQAGDPAWQPR